MKARPDMRELEALCGCGDQNAIHTGGAQSGGWAIYDEVWANASGWCNAPGCFCGGRG